MEKNTLPTIKVTRHQLQAQVTEIKSISKNASDQEVADLISWAEALLNIRSSHKSRILKAKDAIASSLKIKLLSPVIKLIAALVKKHGWDQRSSRSRWGLAASGVAIAVFGGQAAGIAALGGAISVPLWVIFGSGAVFAETLVRELRSEAAKRRTDPPVANAGEIIEGVYSVQGEERSFEQ